MICENCGKEHDGSYGSGRFCSEECARSYSTKNIKGQLKEAKCIDCGKTIYIDKRASLKICKCEECRAKTKCKICGREYNMNDGECKNDFCKHHNPQHFKSLIKYFGFDKSKYGTIYVEEEYNRIRDLLFDLYWNKNLSSSDLAKKFNYKSDPTNITQKFFKVCLNIPIKSVKYATKENFFENRLYIPNANLQYKSGWHTTWNNKEVYLRSSYELDYAKELDKQQIDYEVEFKHIKYWDSQSNEYKCAIPDFYIPSINTIVEIKSNYTLDKQNMIDKFKAYKELGYNYKLICEHKEIQL